MAGNVNWETNVESALSRGQQENKPVFLDFFNPG